MVRPRIDFPRELIDQYEGAAKFLKVPRNALIRHALHEWIRAHVTREGEKIVVKDVDLEDVEESNSEMRSPGAEKG